MLGKAIFFLLGDQLLNKAVTGTLQKYLTIIPREKQNKIFFAFRL